MFVFTTLTITLERKLGGVGPPLREQKTHQRGFLQLIDTCCLSCVVLSGQTPAVSDYQLLEIARRLEMYGVRLHPAKDREGTKLSLSVAHTGVLVFQVPSPPPSLKLKLFV